MATRYVDAEGMRYTISEPYPCSREPGSMLVVVDCRGQGTFSSRTMGAEEVPEYIEKKHLILVSSDK